jgi:hypothetical protein
MTYNLKSIITCNLKIKQIKQICALKDQEWNFGKKSQLVWFKNNVKKYDIHNLFYFKSKLIGYTLLRKRNYKVNNLKKINKFLLLDTLLLDKNYRGRNLSSCLMSFNNLIIKETSYLSFLVCDNEMISFYKKFNWQKINKKNIHVIDYKFSNNSMIFNVDKTYKKYHFYFNE